MFDVKTGRKPQPAFSLVEVLVVVAIIGVLIALLLPAVQQVRAAATRANCQNNLKQIGLALHNYHDCNGAFPSGTITDPNSTFYYWSWMGSILPYVEQQGLWDQAYQYATTVSTNPMITGNNFETGATLNPQENPAVGTLIKTWTCPADSRTLQTVNEYGLILAFTALLGNAGTDSGYMDGVLYQNSQMNFSLITDGISTTLLVGERPPSEDLLLGWWFAGGGYDGSGLGDVTMGTQAAGYGVSGFLPNCQPANLGLWPGSIQNDCDQTHYFSLHPGGANFLFCDGSVKFLLYSANSVLPQLGTAAGGEVVATDY